MNGGEAAVDLGVWTHPLVLGYAAHFGGRDPVAAIEREARDLVLRRLDEQCGTEVCGSAPRSARERYDAALQTAYDMIGASRTSGIIGESREDNWQLRVVCDVAAGELLLAPGAVPSAEAARPSLERLLELRRRLGVTTASVLRRAMILTDAPVAAFVAEPVGDGSQVRIEYVRASRAWPEPVLPGRIIEAPDWLLRSDGPLHAGERGAGSWTLPSGPVRAEAVALDRRSGAPRIAGLLYPLTDVAMQEAPAHTALSYRSRFAGANECRVVTIWVTLSAAAGGAQPDGHVDIAQDEDERTLWATAAVRDSEHRLGLRAMLAALRTIGDIAIETGGEVWFPMLRGADRKRWPVVRDLLVGELSARSVAVRIDVGDEPSKAGTAAQSPGRTAPVSV